MVNKSNMKARTRPSFSEVDPDGSKALNIQMHIRSGVTSGEASLLNEGTLAGKAQAITAKVSKESKPKYGVVGPKKSDKKLF